MTKSLFKSLAFCVVSWYNLWVKNIIDLRNSSLSADRQTSGEQKKELASTESFEISGKIYSEQQTVHKPFAMVIAVFFVLIGLAYIFFQNNILTAIFFFLISLIITIFTFKEKRTIFWEITRHGVTIDASFYPFRDLKTFWIEYQPNFIKEISFKSKKWHQGYLKIPLQKENPLKIREFLLDFLPEERHEDTLVETINRKLGI